VYELDKTVEPVGAAEYEQRETFLWDLAGQPGYRLIHQLGLHEAALALIVFDPSNELDPFSGVMYWYRALNANRQGVINVHSIPVLLVAARVDRGGLRVSRDRVETLARKLGASGYFETSAKQGWGIDQLRVAIKATIDWSLLPKIHSTSLFREVQAFIVSANSADSTITAVDALWERFCSSHPKSSLHSPAAFETCLRLLEARGLIRRLSFGDLVLLKPEVLDSYASAIVLAARNEPDGLGSLREDLALDGSFEMPHDERLGDRRQERLLLIATVQTLIEADLALREVTDDGVYLVLPSQLQRQTQQPTASEDRTNVTFEFDGAVLNVYATLAVRLSRSQIFRNVALYRNHAIFEAASGGQCSLYVKESGEGHGELSIHFDQAVADASRTMFETYVHAHLQRRAVPASVEMRRALNCPTCGFVVTDQTIRLRREYGKEWIHCPVCETRLPLPPQGSDLDESGPGIEGIDRSADTARSRSAVDLILAGKRATSEYDVFLAHRREDSEAVEGIARKLMDRGVMPWLDTWDAAPGENWQHTIEEKLSRVRSVAVFIGPTGAPWQEEEMRGLLRRFVAAQVPIIPILLPGATAPRSLPIFLRHLVAIDLSKASPDPVDLLTWGITGERSMT
jgi:hypothetical protein